MDLDELTRLFTHHPPQSKETQRLHNLVRDNCLTLAKAFFFELPDSKEKDKAFDYLIEAMMWANRAIALHAPSHMSPYHNIFRCGHPDCKRDAEAGLKEIEELAERDDLGGK